jgi:protocatechuate 3,4-dioxygenase beta subunit
VLLAVCAGLCAQDTLVDGTAIDSANGRPLAGVHVRVFTIGASGNLGSYGALTDRDGHFSISGIKPGSYLYFGQKTGYVSLRKGGGGAAVPFDTLSLKAGDKLTGMKLEMQPRATISGRVLDEYGDPMQNVNVQVTPVSPDAPVAFSLTNASAQTDDRGEYRIPVAGGRYHVKANLFSSGNRGNEIRTDGTAPPAYIPTYYPSAGATDRAAAVDVAVGAEVRGIDIRMTSVAGKGAPAVDGTVTGAADLRPTIVYLFVSETSGRYSFFQTASASDGRFRFNALRPGRYRMFARMQSGERTMQSQTVEFADSAPPSGVELRLTTGSEVVATVAVEGGKLPPGRRSVRLRPAGDMTVMMGPTPAADLDAEGNARVGGVFPGKYRAVVQPLPDGMYIRSVDLDGAVGDELDFTRGGGRLKITLAPNAAQVSGTVVEKDGARLGNTVGAVILIRDRAKPEIDDEDSVNRLAADGSYSFKGLRPGKYWLLAIDFFRAGDFGNADAMKKFVEFAEEIEVKEGEKLRKDVHVVTKEMVDAKPKQ